MSGLSGLNPGLRPAAQWTLDVAAHYGVPVTVTSVYRSWQSQRELYDRYRRSVEAGTFRRPGGVQYPANRPGDSAHNWGLAWDSTVPERYQEWWNYVRRLAGFEVLPNDVIHAQLPNWRDYVGSLAAPS